MPCGAVRDVPEALADPQVLAREMIQSVEHAAAGLLKVVGVPIKLSETPGSVRTAPPTLGQHTVSILRELQIGDDEIDTLARTSAIGARSCLSRTQAKPASAPQRSEAIGDLGGSKTHSGRDDDRSRSCEAPSSEV